MRNLKIAVVLLICVSIIVLLACSNSFERLDKKNIPAKTIVDVESESSFLDRKTELESFALCGNYIASQEEMENNLLVFLQSNHNEVPRNGYRDNIEISLISKQTATIDDSKKNTRCANIEAFEDINFYLYSIHDGEKDGFAITSTDRRIGNILAVIDDGKFNPEDEFMQFFGGCLYNYVVDTVETWNEITDDSLQRTATRLADEDWMPQYCRYSNVEFIEGNTDCILKTKWGQRNVWRDDDGPYNDAIEFVYGKDYLAGCTTIALAQVMAFHYSKTNGLKTKVDSGTWKNLEGWERLKKVNWTDCKYDWNKIMSSDSIYWLSEIGKTQLQTFLLDVSQRIGVSYGVEETTGTTKKIKKALNKYNFSHDGISSYSFDKVKESINNGYPVIIGATSIIKEKKFLWFTYYERKGHEWVIDGWSKFKFTATNNKTKSARNFNGYFLHCNVGWSGSRNGYYYQGIFDMRGNSGYISDDMKIMRNTIGNENNYQYDSEIITNIHR